MAKQILLTEADVLSGHKQKWNINQHPGNRFLQQLADQYCEEYLNTPTQFRHVITNKIVKIQDRGGRFLKIVDTDGIDAKLEQQDERASAGKITKMLRQRGNEIENMRQLQGDSLQLYGDGGSKKRSRDFQDDHEQETPKAATTTTDKFGFVMSPRSSNRMRINYLAEATPPRRPGTGIWEDNRRIHYNQTNAPDYDSDDGSFDDVGHSMWRSFEQNSERVDSDAEWNANYQKLRQFFANHGHSGISPDWDQDPNLAEWSTRQRHLFREIQSGYRIATLREENRWKQLQMVNFPLNYEKWHWERKYRQLKEILKGEKYNEKNVKLSEELKAWLDHQRKLMKNDGSIMTSKPLEYDRMERLKSLGV